MPFKWPLWPASGTQSAVLHGVHHALGARKSRVAHRVPHENRFAELHYVFCQRAAGHRSLCLTVTLTCDTQPKSARWIVNQDESALGLRKDSDQAVQRANEYLVQITSSGHRAIDIKDRVECIG